MAENQHRELLIKVPNSDKMERTSVEELFSTLFSQKGKNKGNRRIVFLRYFHYGAEKQEKQRNTISSYQLFPDRSSILTCTNGSPWIPSWIHAFMLFRTNSDPTT
ncbi:hypothetical protein XENORESO_016192 [Xenotaenia resolanae]|uniref:Uncharacterized protein n=1 Tax=Xenotaenia resolanae TaxID=208358 RepID=A0ABV0WYP8_9TELE